MSLNSSNICWNMDPIWLSLVYVAGALANYWLSEAAVKTCYRSKAPGFAVIYFTTSSLVYIVILTHTRAFGDFN